MAETTTADAPAQQAGRPVLRTLLPGAAMVAVGFGLARYGYGLLLPEMRADLGISAGAAGLIASGTYASYLVANLLVVAVTDRWGPRTAVAAAAACAVLGMSIMAVAGSPLVLAGGVLLAGAASGLAYPPYAGLVAQRVPERQRDVVWSAISSGTGWGVALAGPIAIAFGGSWRLAWSVFVAIALVVGIVATLLAPSAPHHDRTRRPRLSWSWFVCPRSRPLLVAAVLVGAGSSVWWSFSVDAFRQAGLGADWSRTAYTVCGVAGVLASLSGAVFDRIGLRVGYLGCAVLLAAALALLTVSGATAGLACMSAVLFGVFYNGIIAAQGIWSSRVFSDHPAAGLAAVNTALTLGTLAGPVLAGAAIARVGYPPTLLAAAVVLLAAVPFCPPTTQRRRHLDAHREHCRATPASS